MLKEVKINDTSSITNHTILIEYIYTQLFYKTKNYVIKGTENREVICNLVIKKNIKE